MYDETLVEALVAHFGPEHTAELLQLMRCPPSLTTLRVNTLRSTRDAALAQLRAELEAIEDPIVKIRLSGPAASVMTVRVAVTQKLREKMPSIAAVQLI